MGRYNTITNDTRFFKYQKIAKVSAMTYPIRTFSKKSRNEYFVAIADSLPAVFNMETGKYYVRLMNTGGQLIFSSQFDHAGGSMVKIITTDHVLAKGIYFVEVSNATTRLATQKLLVQ